MDKVAIIGLGYVGLPTACLAATVSFDTLGYDTNIELIKELIQGSIRIKDQTVQNLFLEAQKSNNLLLSADSECLKNSKIFVICVPTPINSNNEPDLSPLISAIKAICKKLPKGALIIIESTVFPGTCSNILVPLINELTGFNCGVEYNLAHCPERINPGDLFWNIKNIPRVLGGITVNCANRAANFYSKLLNGPVMNVKESHTQTSNKYIKVNEKEIAQTLFPQSGVAVMNSITDAEAVKIMENTTRDVNIAFTNELAKISNVLKVDIVDVIQGMSTKPFGKGPFYPGIGVGGHCIAVDPEWLKSASSNAGFFPDMIQLARNINKSMPKYAIEQLEKWMEYNHLRNLDLKLAILGTAYKKNISDLRESPFFKVKEYLEAMNSNINIFDSFNNEYNTHNTLGETLKGRNVVVIITDHDDMVNDFKELLKVNRTINVIIDGRNCLNRIEVPKNIDVLGIGKIYS